MPTELTSSNPDLIRCATAATFWLGLGACFAGYRGFRFFAALLGLLGGAWAGWTFGPEVFGGNRGVATLVAAGSAVVAAVLLSAFKGALGKLAWGALVGGLAGAFAARQLQIGQNSSVMVIAAAIGAVLTVAVPRHVIIVATSILGGVAMASAGYEFAGTGSIDPHRLLEIADYSPTRISVVLVVALAAAGSGMYLQYVCSPGGTRSAVSQPADAHQPQRSPSSSAASRDGSTVEKRLQVLKQLLDQELISDREYSARRESILKDL